MIVVKLKKWVPINGLEHLSTTWQIATDENFTNILEESENSDMLEMYYSDITVPVDVSYYVRAKRHFNDSLVDYWSEVITVSNIEEAYSAMLLEKDNVIDEPMIFLDINQFQNTEATFTVTTSSYRGILDAHLYTHWILTDYNNKVIYSSLYDSVNKTSISIPKSINIADRSNLLIRAIHVASGGVESKIGMLDINVSEFNFDIVTKLTNVIPNTDLIVNIVPIDNTKSTMIEKIEITDPNTNEILLTPVMNNNLFTIPWYMLGIESVININIYAFDKQAKYSKLIKRLTVDKYNKELKEPDYTYNITLSAKVSEVDIHIPNFITSEYDVLGRLLSPKVNQNSISLLQYTDGLIEDTGMILNGVSLLNANNEGTYIKQFNTNMLLIDTFNNNDKPVFMVYTYNVHNNVYILDKTIERVEETSCIGRTNAIVQIDNRTFLYNPVGTDKIMKYDIVNNTISEINNIPLLNITKGIFIKLPNNRLLIAGGEDFNTVVYNIDTNKFSDGISSVPGLFVNTDLKVHELINGDSIIFRTSDSDNEKSILYFDFETQKFVDNDLTFESDFPTSTISTNKGDIYMSKYYKEDIYTSTPAYSVVRNFK